METPNRIEEAILHLTAASGPARSICPSQVARELEPEWRRHMTAVRRAAARLAEAGRIDILRKGRPVTAEAVKGVIRLRIRPDPAE